MEKRSERITYDDVANICDIFSSANIEPTVLKIYSILERGSNSTIAKHLERWKEESNRAIKLSIKTIRFLESEIENEALKMSSKAKRENAQLSSDLKIIEEDLDIANRKIESLEVKLTNQNKEHEKTIINFSNQLEAEKLEKDSFKQTSMKLELDNRDLLTRLTAIETKYNLSLENEKKLEAKIDNLEKDKENLLIKLGELKSIIASKK